MAIDFSCSSCEKSYRVKEELAGKTAECSACGKKMRIPMLVSAASDSGLNLNQEPKGLIDDVLPTKSSATLTPAMTQKCPECTSPLALDAVLCVVCGYDKRSGDILETESEREIEKGEERTSADHLKRGGAFSFLGAMLAAGVWLGLAIALGVGVEVGYPALLVGILAGMGMKYGYGGTPSFIAGVVASVMSMAGIFAAKGLIFDHLRSQPRIEIKQETPLEEVAGEVVHVFTPETMIEMFGIYDVLFIVVAMGAAYALARGDHALKTEEL